MDADADEPTRERIHDQAPNRRRAMGCCLSSAAVRCRLRFRGRLGRAVRRDLDHCDIGCQEPDLLDDVVLGTVAQRPLVKTASSSRMDALPRCHSQKTLMWSTSSA